MIWVALEVRARSRGRVLFPRVFGAQTGADKATCDKPSLDAALLAESLRLLIFCLAEAADGRSCASVCAFKVVYLRKLPRNSRKKPPKKTHLNFSCAGPRRGAAFAALMTKASLVKTLLIGLKARGSRNKGLIHAGPPRLRGSSIPARQQPNAL